MTEASTRSSGARPKTNVPPAPAAMPSRVTIGSLQPEVEGGFPAKRCLGDSVIVRAQVVADGHDALAGVLRYRYVGEGTWRERPLTRENAGLDTWTATFEVDRLGEWEFTVAAWVDHYGSWLHGLGAKVAAGQDVSVACEEGARLLESIAEAGPAKERTSLVAAATALRGSSGERALAIAADSAVVQRVARAWRPRAVAEGPVRRLFVDPQIARYGSWYEFFPRSTGAPGEHGTFASSLPRLRYAANMGFDIVYLPPIHPIGRTNRKGPNNAPAAGLDDPGSPWAIGAVEGGHRAIHPALGTFDDFRAFLAEAGKLGVEVALDLAFQCSPDHPLVTEHPEWFRHLPDGSIAYAENPPKRYEDIVPFDFECEDWRGLWEELLRITQFWIDEGIRIFRVDNPHTKPLPFWEWLIGEIKKARPEVIFLAEAFARPALVHGLARRGFSQSYTYFAWRNTRDELESYLTELADGPGREYLRPNLWPNTPDILTEYLQAGGRPAAIVRLVLAATLSASYGIYGPTFETLPVRGRSPGERGVPGFGEVPAPDMGHRRIVEPLTYHQAGERSPHGTTLRCTAMTARSFHPTITTAHLLQQTAARKATTMWSWSSTSTRTSSQSGWVIHLPPPSGGNALSMRHIRCMTCSVAATTFGRARTLTCELDPQSTPAHILQCRMKLRTERISTISSSARRNASPTKRQSRRKAARALDGRPRGTRTRSSTSCTSARSMTATATASATSAG